ncbi:MAG: ornithine cyclodeaminase family protein [Actinomycetota bacterium]
MQVIDAATVRDRTPWPVLVESIAEELRRGVVVAPERHVHGFGVEDGSEGSLLLMPAWSDGELAITKVVTYVGSNADRALPTVSSIVLAFDGADGRPLATIDGDALTARRTAAVSALAARHLAPVDAARLLVVGTGALAPNLAAAHATVRPIEAVEIWGRRPDRAAAVAATLAGEGLPATPVDDLATGVARADIVSCATGATEPLVRGVWLGRRTHLELVGSFSAAMRECDDEAIRRGTVFVDARAGALAAGDLARPIEDGVLDPAHIAADLAGLVRGDHPGRGSDDQLTIFKSAGTAAADLAATRLVLAAG